jgi:hypothetical protein
VGGKKFKVKLNIFIVHMGSVPFSVLLPFFAACGSVGTVHYQHDLAHSCLEAFGNFLWLNGFGTTVRYRFIASKRNCESVSESDPFGCV